MRHSWKPLPAAIFWSVPVAVEGESRRQSAVDAPAGFNAQCRVGVSKATPGKLRGFKRTPATPGGLTLASIQGFWPKLQFFSDFGEHLRRSKWCPGED